MAHATITYAFPVFLLIATIAVFFAFGRGHYANFGKTQNFLRIVAVFPLLGSAILLHFLRPGATASIIPPTFPAPYFLVLLTGVFEIAGAVALDNCRVLFSYGKRGRHSTQKVPDTS